MTTTAPAPVPTDNPEHRPMPEIGRGAALCSCGHTAVNGTGETLADHLREHGPGNDGTPASCVDVAGVTFEVEGGAAARIARRADLCNENGGAPTGGYTLAQALATCLLYDPAWLFSAPGVLVGWYLNTPDGFWAQAPAPTAAAA